MNGQFTVVASVGTYHHPFERFVEWLEPWTTENRARVVLQHGSTSPMSGAENHEVLAPKDLLDHYRDADAIVLQGGAGGVMDARKAGRIPIVVPRIPVDHEVVDNHQVVLCHRLAELGLVHVAESAEELARLLDGTRDGTIATRLAARRSTPGTRAAVRLLAAVGPLTSYRMERGAVILEPRLRRLPHVWTILSGFMNRGLLAYALALGAALLVNHRVDLSAGHERITLGLVALWLFASFAVTPEFARARSLQPAAWFVGLAAVGAAAAFVAGVDGSPELRDGFMVGLASAATLTVATLVYRLLFRRIPTVLVGSEASVCGLAAQWKDRRDVKVVATCAWSGDTTALPDGSIAELIPQALGAVNRNNACSVVVVSVHSLERFMLRDLAWALRRSGAACLVLSDGTDVPDHTRAREVAGRAAFSIRPPAEHLIATVVKDTIDRVVAAIALVLLAPLFIVLSLVLRVTLQQPAILRQARTGRDGVPYVMYTFRTAISTASEGQVIPPLGRFLRRTSIDELPRLLNVLNGDMSLVGPRASPPAAVVRYDDRTWRRLTVRPGLTGLSQVSGRSRLTQEESINLDLQYVDQWSLRLDARILARTLRIALNRDLTR